VNGFDAYLDKLASAEPTPGGGSAATVVGALGAALCGMVARITARSPRHHAAAALAERLAEEADALRERFVAARLIDEEAYGAVVAASGLPKRTDAEQAARTAALQAALIGAADAPLAAAGLSAEGILLTERAYGLGNTHLVSDVECALRFFQAALAACIANVRINHRFIKETAVLEAQNGRLVAIVSAAHAVADRLHSQLS